jgi:methanogenic corrinoid protein MtbC1
MATAVIRSFLGDLLVSADGSHGAPRIVVTTPPGEWHEIGALMVAVEAAGLGWKPVYLGPNLPAEEILSASEQTHAKAVALSVVQGTDDFHLIRDLKKLRQYLPEKVPLMVGGRAAETMKGAFDQMGILSVTELAAFRERLPSMGMVDET